MSTWVLNTPNLRALPTSAHIWQSRVYLQNMEVEAPLGNCPTLVIRSHAYADVDEGSVVNMEPGKVELLTAHIQSGTVSLSRKESAILY